MLRPALAGPLPDQPGVRPPRRGVPPLHRLLPRQQLQQDRGRGGLEVSRARLFTRGV